MMDAATPRRHAHTVLASSHPLGVVPRAKGASPPSIHPCVIELLPSPTALHPAVGARARYAYGAWPQHIPPLSLGFKRPHSLTLLL